jgi:hypothetical protein
MRWYIFIGVLLLLPVVCWAQGQENEIARYTEMIGTAEQPTIEGGFINRAEKDVIVKSSASFNTTEEKKTAMIAIHPATREMPDEFSSDKNIKQLLTTAARDHKLAYVLHQANQWKLPATVALIPMVESHYQTDAVSPKGAKGAWQLMPATAKDYGLKSKARENFAASTDSALHLLSDLHQQFGNWTLAFAAYNAGSARVMLALHHHPQAQFIDDLDLPVETKRYVYRLKQIVRVMARLSMNNSSPACH